MKITTVLFDLDGTLLPMDQDTFAGAYVRGLAMTAAPYGYEPKAFAKAVMAGTVAMVKNDGRKTNEEAFWDSLAESCGGQIREQEHIFDPYYETDFQKIKDVCGFAPQAREIIRLVEQKDLTVALATNPLFPKVATESRVRWAGLQPEDFRYITTYENSRYCKPNLDYYRELLGKLNVQPEECLMVGNDVTEDMVIAQLGMQVFLLTDCLINKQNVDLTQYPYGNFEELKAFIEAI